MYKRTILIAATIAAFFLPLNILAENGNSMNGLSREERLNNAVADQQIVLDDSAKQLVQAKCQNAQLILTTIQDQTEGLIRKRLDTYNNVQKELQAIKLRMIRQGADASETDLLTGKIQQSLDVFTIQANRYSISLDDVATIDCIVKPEQFKAGIILMRSQRAKLLDTSKELKYIMDDSDNNVFNQLKDRLRI